MSRSRSGSYVSGENLSLDESDGWKSEERVRRVEPEPKTKTCEKRGNLLSNKRNSKEKLENLPRTKVTSSENDEERRGHCSCDNRFTAHADKEGIEQKTKDSKILPKTKLASSEDDEDSKLDVRKSSKIDKRSSDGRFKSETGISKL